MNYASLVFLLICALYFCSFWIELKSSFLQIIVQVSNVMAWTMTIMSVLLAVLALFIITSDPQFRAIRLVWVIVRMLICIIVSIVVDVTSMLISSGISVSL